jgi:nitroimidazol reductase NimA-like FMN-containing flavoprotein (pyridoxamine 5'-phosphate oxidase superfamily)
MAEFDALQPMCDVIEPLSDAECRELLARQSFGRVGITSGGLPLILPVHYFYDDGVIVFRTGVGTKLRAAANGDVLAFEVDHYDAQTGRGWSVMVLGRAAIVVTEHEHDRFRILAHAAAAEERNHYVRLFCEIVTGRVIEKAAHH